MEMTYGMNIANSQDRFLRAAAEASEILAKAFIPGAFLVDTIPMCAFHRVSRKLFVFDSRSKLVKHIPEWFPGAKFQTFARQAREHSDVAVNGPLEYVKKSMKVRPQSHVSQC